MSRRRLERANQRREVGAAVPVELGDPGHPLWESEDDVAALVAACGLPDLTPRTLAFLDPAWERFRAFRLAFCVARGITGPEGRAPDWQRAREAGIFTGGGSGSRRYGAVTGH